MSTPNDSNTTNQLTRPVYLHPLVLLCSMTFCFPIGLVLAVLGYQHWSKTVQALGGNSSFGALVIDVFKSRWVQGFAALSVFTAIVSPGSRKHDSGSVSGSSAEEQTSAAGISGGGRSLKAPAAKGVAYGVGVLETTVTDARVSRTATKDYFSYSASEGAKLVIVDYSVKNTGNEAKQCLSFADSLTDSTGASYETTFECNMAVKSFNITDKLNPGLQKNFQACFEVPEGASGFTVHFKCLYDDGYFSLGG